MTVGGRLVTEAVNLMAIGTIKGLSLRGRFVLVTVCSVARDRDQKNVEAGVYFAGWEYLGRALGYPEFTFAAKQAVAASIRELRSEGLLEPLVLQPRGGVRQVYRVTLPPLGSL